MAPDFLEKYVVPDAFHNSAERYDPPKCHPHTREAILKRIMLWVDDPANEAQIMWMFGPAGAGKSAIAQSIAEMCFQQGKLAASFFFSRNASGRDNETRFISTLVYQLVLAIPEIKDAVNKALEDDGLLLSRSLHDQAQSLITKPLNDCLTSSSENGFQSPRPRLIIVDGLDECGEPKNQRYVLDVLSKVTRQLTYPLLFLVASRPEQIIRDSFRKESMRSITTRLALDHTYEPDTDIEQFLRSKFQDIIMNHPSGADIPSGWPSDSDIWRLVKSPPDNLSMHRRSLSSWNPHVTSPKRG
jgi:NACHT domain